MGSFVVSARKYRPSSFGTVVGQKNITSTLKNAIKNDHLSQSFLFCGPRGVGKTSCARILAKTVNCFNIADSENIEACNECESCKSFNDGHSLNIYELDAASNNSVDGIRSLVDQVRLAPQIGNRKIYIIDEVHMLSQQAFNAFLKTLEEPPEHAMFILATTEKHKIIPTILSRCQIFNFSRISVADIVSQLERISKSESIEAEPRALHAIAQQSDGAMRDALSMFDQIVGFAGNKMTYEHVIENLNLLNEEYFFKTATAIYEHNVSAGLLIFDEILKKGFDAQHFIVGLGNHFRNLLISQDPKTIHLIETAANIKKQYYEQSKLYNDVLIIHILNALSKCDVNYRSSKNQRLHVELCLIFITKSDLVEKKNDQPQITTIQETVSTPPKPAPNSPSPAINQETPPPPTAPPPQFDSLDPSSGPHGVTDSEKKRNQILKAVSSPSKSAGSKLKGTISIADIMAKKAQEDDAKKDEPIMPFTQEEFLTAWHASILKYKDGGKINLYNTLTKKNPVVDANFNFEIEINNSVQEESITVEKLELLAELRIKLKNHKINLITIVTESKDEYRPYTTLDKFKKMAVKNPKMIELHKRIDLDINN